MGKAKPEAVEMAKDFKSKAGKKYGIKKMFLFGSMATGKTHRWSDIDLLIVSDRFRNRIGFMSKLSAEWHITQGKNFPVDFLPYRTREFNRMSRRITIVRQALEEGVEI